MENANESITDPTPVLDKSVKGFLTTYKEPIALILSFGSSLWLFITNLKVSHNFKEFSKNVNSFLTFVEVLNVCILIMAIIVLSQKYTLKKKKGSEAPNLLTLEPLEDDLEKKTRSVDWKIDRVNRLVAQLVLSLQGFTVVLLFMYLLLSLTDLEHPVLNKKDKVKMKREDFVNDYIEKFDVGSEYNQILDHFDKNANKAISSLNKDRKYINVKLKSPDTLFEKLHKNFQNDITPPDTIGAFISNYGQVMVNNKTYTEYQAKLDSIKWADTKATIDSLCLVRGELGIIKKRNETLESKKNLIDMFYRYDPLDRFAMRYLIIEFVENAFNLFSAAFLFIAFQVLFTVTLSDDNRTSRINYWLPLSLAGAILLVNFLGITIGIGNMPLSSISHLVRLLSGIYNGIGMMLLYGRFISMEYFYKKETNFKRRFYYVGTIVVLPFYAIAQPLYGIFDLDNKDVGNALILKSVVLLICFIGKLFLFLFISLVLSNEWIHKYFYWILLKSNSMDAVSDQIKKDLEITH